MNNRQALWQRATVACFLVLTMFTVVCMGQEPPATVERKDIEGQLVLTLRDIINRGREFYNTGNPASCYFMFQGALQVTVPLLEHRPALQKFVANSLVEAEANPDMRQRAWMLRNVMDRIRSELKGEMVARPKPADPGAKGAEKIDAPGAGAKDTLWKRLGGLDAVGKVVDDFVVMAAADDKVNFTRDGKYKPTDEQIATLKKHLVAFMSAASGGPIKYTGKSMKEVHKDMAITDAEFDATVDVLLKAMEKNGVKEDDAKAVRGAVEGLRKDIVTKKAE
jgi:hemoglobin